MLSLYGPPAPTTGLGFKIDENGYYRCVLTNRLIHRVLYYRAHKGTNGQWHIHHINGNKLDNRLENLIALPSQVHTNLHKTWGMSYLPNRKELLFWWKQTNGKLSKRAIKRKNKKGLSFREWKPGPDCKPKLKKVFEAKIIVRKRA